MRRCASCADSRPTPSTGPPSRSAPRSIVFRSGTSRPAPGRCRSICAACTPPSSATRATRSGPAGRTSASTSAPASSCGRRSCSAGCCAPTCGSDAREGSSRARSRSSTATPPSAASSELHARRVRVVGQTPGAILAAGIVVDLHLFAADRRLDGPLFLARVLLDANLLAHHRAFAHHHLLFHHRHGDALLREARLLAGGRSRACGHALHPHLLARHRHLDALLLGVNLL